jgi:hypothetical protein
MAEPSVLSKPITKIMDTFNFPVFLIFECWSYDYDGSETTPIGIKSNLDEAKSFVEDRCKIEPLDCEHQSYIIIKILDFGELDGFNNQVASYELNSNEEPEWTIYK